MLTVDFQKEIPLTQWVFPINPNVQLPESFQYAAQSEKFLTIAPDWIEQNYNKWLKAWTEWMIR